MFADVELAAYLGCSKMQPVHRFLALRRALTVSWKAQNYITAATVSSLWRFYNCQNVSYALFFCDALQLQFARKLIQTPFSQNVKGTTEAIAQVLSART